VLPHLLLEVRLHRATRNRQSDRHLDAAALDGNGAHHFQLDNAAADLGIDDGDQRRPHILLGNHGRMVAPTGLLR
jgi:hypothetical protein